jgi:iron complex outermembrane receptor protein
MAAGQSLESRNRLTLAGLNQVSVEYIGKFFDEHLRVDLGVRDPFLSRDLNQYCYTSPPQNVYCNATAAQAATAGYAVAPFSITKTYSRALPNVGATWNFDQQHSVFVDYTEAMNAPVNDDLYAIGVVGVGLGTSSTSNPGTDNVQPETSRTLEGGYRYQTARLKATIDGYYMEDNNHILSTYNLDTGDTVDTNVGSIHFYGFEAQVGWVPIDHLTLVASLSYEHSEVMNDIPYSATYTAPTKGLQFYDTPPWMIGGSANYDWSYFKFGGQIKFVDARYATALNDLQVPSYETVDVYVRANLDMIRPGTYLQFNVNNLFNEKYIGSINYATTNNPANTQAYSQSYADQGSPQTLQVTLHAQF